jgi:hypothetical protein
VLRRRSIRKVDFAAPSMDAGAEFLES